MIEDCPACKGSGFSARPIGSIEFCQRCGGYGSIVSRKPDKARVAERLKQFVGRALPKPRKTSVNTKQQKRLWTLLTKLGPKLADWLNERTK